MKFKRLRNLRFRLASVFVLFLGIAIGYSLNLQTFRLLFGPASEARLSRLPEYRIAPPDTLYVNVGGDSTEFQRSIKGSHLVCPDGTIRLGEFGQIDVAGKTIPEVEDLLKSVVADSIHSPYVFAKVETFNSKFYYVIVNRPAGDSVLRIPIRGKETVMDAFAAVGRLDTFKRGEVWLSRPSANPSAASQRIDIDLDSIVRGVSTNNYQLMPGDRLFVSQQQSSTNAVNVRSRGSN